MLRATGSILRYTQGVSLAEFRANPEKMDAVMRNFIMLGEACARIPVAVREAHPDIPWADIRGMRNVLVHEYEVIDLRTIWTTVEHDLPGLVGKLRAILNE